MLEKKLYHGTWFDVSNSLEQLYNEGSFKAHAGTRTNDQRHCLTTKTAIMSDYRPN